MEKRVNSRPGSKKGLRYTGRGKKGRPPLKPTSLVELLMAHSPGTKKRKMAVRPEGEVVQLEIIEDAISAEGKGSHRDTMEAYSHKLHVTMSKLMEYDFMSNDTMLNGRGRIMAFWKKNALQVLSSVEDTYWVGVCLKDLRDGKEFVIFGIYLPTRLADRLESLIRLEVVVSRVDGPCMVIGDFNAMMGSWNKTGAHPLARSSLAFNRFITSCNLSEVEDPSKKFTWSNHRMGSQTVLCKLDWCFVNNKWITEFGGIGELKVTTSSTSDHSFLMYRNYMKGRLIKGRRPFRLFKPWIMDIDGLDIVKKEWAAIVTGCPMIKLLKKLGLVKAALLRWNAEKFDDVLMVSKASISSFCAIKEMLEQFERLAGMKVNKDKSIILLEKTLDCTPLIQRISGDNLGNIAMELNISVQDKVQSGRRVTNDMVEASIDLSDILESIPQSTEADQVAWEDNGQICLGVRDILNHSRGSGKLRKLMNILFYIARRRAPSNMLYFEVAQVETAGQLRVAGNSYFSDGTNGVSILLNSRGRVLAGELEVLDKMFRPRLAGASLAKLKLACQGCAMTARIWIGQPGLVSLPCRLWAQQRVF
ncbi:hypothetical protein EJ110_NYTH26793 [Nymphaea thermarum]|nr:hypothetical protein EJ110_NYTH26793 [Nymphaea thermarum]